MNPRVWAFFALAVVAGAQYPAVQHAYLEVEASADGRQRATLSLSPAIDTRMKEAFARAAGCLPGDLQPERYGSRVRVRCAASRPDRLRVHTELRFDTLAPLLAFAGIRVVDVSLVAPRMDDVNIEPPMPASGLYHHASYSLDELPEKIAVDAGFGPRHLRNLAAGIAGLLLLPFILAVLRARNIPQLYALVQATFLAGWTGWTWILARTQAWTLCDLASGIRFAGPLLLVATPLAAVWVGSQLAAIQYARIAPEGSDEAAYRRSKFWIGALIVFLFSTIVGLFSAIESSQLGWTWAGIAATVLCVVQLYRSSRGGSYALPEGPLRARIFALAAQAGVRLRGVTILLGSERRPPAAFATRWGVILLTESLVRNLSRREVDAVVCHEFSHMNPTRSAGMAGIYVAVVATVMGAQFAPGMIQALPLAIVGSVLLFKAWRRSEERKADRDSVRWSRDPEALISGLTRGSRAAGMPLEWGPPVSWMIGHPSTAERFRLIAQAGNLPGSRIAELMEQATAEAADRYEVGDSVSQEAMFPTILKQRLKTRLALLALGGPAIFGFAATWILRKAGLGTWPVIAIAVPAASAAFYACYEWMVGGVRENVRRRWLAR
ncbi:MAG: M48 family metalloprotease, partial [Acidobacteriia bacterium]|nr:M48 family metalloprotease [Terriglobia bacterium]